MNIQIFGIKKCNDTKKAERFFKERGIKYQFIDMKEKGMSKGEFNARSPVDFGSAPTEAERRKLEKVLENPQVIKTPVVRNGKQATLGYQPDVWKGWN